MCVAIFPMHTQTQWLYHLVPFGAAYFIISMKLIYIYRAISTSLAGMTMAVPSAGRYKNFQNLICCLQLICNMNIVFAQIVLTLYIM